jgi:hypothetical protein
MISGKFVELDDKVLITVSIKLTAKVQDNKYRSIEQIRCDMKPIKSHFSKGIGILILFRQ